jgi:hypothetical protein
VRSAGANSRFDRRSLIVPTRVTGRKSSHTGLQPAHAAINSLSLHFAAAPDFRNAEIPKFLPDHFAGRADGP